MDWELPRSGGEEEPHEPTSHVSREPSLPSRQLPAGRRPSAAGGPGGAGRGTLRTPGSADPEGPWPLPPAEAGTPASADGGRRGRGPPTGCVAALPGGGPALGGSIPQSPQANGGSSGAGRTASARAHSVRGSESQLPSPHLARLSPAPPALLLAPSRFPQPRGRGPGLGPGRFPGFKPRPPPVPGEGGGPATRPPPLGPPWSAAPCATATGRAAGAEGSCWAPPPQPARAPALSPAPRARPSGDTVK